MVLRSCVSVRRVGRRYKTIYWSRNKEKSLGDSSCLESSGRSPSSARTKFDFTLHPSATLPRVSLPVSSQNYEDMKYDHDMKIGKITHKDNQDTSTTRRLKSTEVLLSRHGRFRPQLALRRTNRSATAGLLGNPTKRRRRQSPLVPNSLGSTTRCIRA